MKDIRGETIMYDTIENIGESLVQHGKYNDRIYLMKLSKKDFPHILKTLSKLAYDNKYAKLFAKIPVWAVPGFKANGFIIEGMIPGFYEGITDGFFVSKFMNSDRVHFMNVSKLNELSTLLGVTKAENFNDTLQNDYKLRKLTETDIPALANVYRKTFDSYPFPIMEEDFLQNVMHEHVHFFGAFHGKDLVAVSSAETDEKSKNVEMTDFATLDQHRGKKLSIHLLMKMEDEMKNSGYKITYTIARLNSIPMNKTFLRLGYRYSGTLINNTNISGSIESMNIYYKQL